MYVGSFMITQQYGSPYVEFACITNLVRQEEEERKPDKKRVRREVREINLLMTETGNIGLLRLSGSTYSSFW
jgi:hypothetical protein